MTDTQKRISAYRKALPHMKERVTAVALLLAISVAMMTSATFAWMTLSRSPEASSMFTTVSTNGNLEIALSGADGLQPNDTAIGDGAGSITETNLTWGNLINLSDVSYGLKDIVLRPASLNTTTLATNPMHAVQYGADGRVTGYLYDFMYSNYVEDPESGAMFFSPEDVIKYGVRAISTVTYEDVTGDAVMIRKIEEMESSLIEAKRSFENIYDIENSAAAKQYMSAVGGLVGVHVDYTLNGTRPDASAYMTDLYELSNAFLLCIVDMGNVLVEGANLCIFMSLEDRSEYDQKAFTFEDLVMGRMTNEAIEERCSGKYDINFTAIDDFRLLWKKMAGYDNVVQGVNSEWKPTNDNGVFVQEVTLPGYSSNYASPTSNSKSIYGAYEIILGKYQDYQKRVMNGSTDQTVPWDNWMLTAVNQMCHMDSATIRYQGGQDYTPNDLLELKSQATSMNMTAVNILRNFMGNGPFHATINDGAIQDVGQLLGKAMYVPSNDAIRIKATASVSILSLDIDMKPSISTSFDNNGYVLDTDIVEAKRVASGGSDYRGDAVAAETYAMVIDFWVRTNVEDTLLTLEGDLIYNQKTGTDSTGRKLGLLFSYPETDEESGNTVTRYVYQHQDKYYYDYEQEGINDELTATQVAQIKDLLKIVYEEKPSGYQGANRVWDELEDSNNQYVQSMLQNNGTSTTQGSGSCYIFYPQSMEDHQQSLRLLSAMRVAFVDADGTLLATAYMDTQNVVEDAGRVIVPLRLRTQDNTVTDKNGITIDEYITPLMKNEAKRISAIVYLEGADLKNSEVLAAGSISGQMNIQFGTTEAKMNALHDDAVMKEYLTFDFTLDGDRDGYPEQDNIYEIPAGAPRMVDLYLDLGDAVTPDSVEGNFVAVINATQGARQGTFTMKINPDTGLWEAYHYVPNEDPKLPGTYVKGIPFSGPGNFQLRSIQIDGVDYLLNDTQIVKVTIPGMAISALSWNDTLQNEKYIRTADSMCKETLTLRLESNDGRAHKIQGVFLGDSGKNVTVTFSSTDNVYYEGVATFSTGGNYTLTYVYVDDELVPLDEALYKQIRLQLGLKVEISYTAPKIMESELRIPDGLTEEEEEAYIAEILKDMVATPKSCYFRFNRLAPLEMEVTCKIYDDQDHELTGLQLPDPALYFGSASNGLDTDLVWDEDADCYKGKFVITKNGIYSFNSLILDDGSAITKAVSSPTITSASPDPVLYVHNLNAYPVFSNGLKDEGVTRTLQFKLKNSQGAAIKVALNNTLPQSAAAAIDDAVEEPQYIMVSNVDGWDNKGIQWAETQPDSNGVVTYTLTLPKDGYWEIVGLYLGGGVYYGKDENGNDKMWTGETDADWADLSTFVQGDNIQSYFLTEVTITASNMPITTRSLNVEFMQRVAGENVFTPKIEVTNGRGGRPLAEVLQEVAALFPEENINSSVEMSFKYSYTKNDAVWTISDVSKLPTELVAALNADGALEMNAAFLVEGDYEPQFTLKIGGEPYTQNIPAALQSSAASTVRVRWTMPELKITAVTNATKDSVSNPTFSVNLKNDSDVWQNSGLAGVQNYFEDYYANVYIMGELGSYSAPSVEMTLSKAGATGAVNVAVGGSEYSCTYTFNKSGDAITQQIGSGQEILGAGDRKRAGRTTISKLGLTYDGTTYTFPLKNSVEIRQDANPYYVDFAITDHAYTGTVPGRKVSPDGKTIQLPVIDNWIVKGVAEATGTKNYPTPTTSSAGTYCYKSGTFSKYTYYSRTQYTTSCQVESKVYDVAYRLQWKVGSNSYNPGDKVEISGTTTISSVVSIVSKEYIKTNTVTYTKTWYTYASTGSGWSSSGTKLGFSPSTSTKYDANNNVYDEHETVS